MSTEHIAPCTIRKERYILKMHEPSIPIGCRISTLFAVDSLAKVFQSLEEGKDLQTMPEAHSFLKLLGLQEPSDLRICSLKTYPDCFRMTKVGHLRPSLTRFQSWGMMSSGRFVTARISVSPNPAVACSLSDFLESDVGEEFHLRLSQLQRILSASSPDVRASASIHRMESPQPSQAAAAASVEKQEST